MRIKLFCASSVEEAMKQIHEDMGEEAIVLSQSTQNGEVEIRAAVRSEPKTGRALQKELGVVQAGAGADLGVCHRLLEALHYHAVPEHLIQIIIDSAERHKTLTNDPQTSLVAGLSRIINCQPLEPEEGRTLLITGMPGSGKTSIVARYTRIRSGFGLPPEPISIDAQGNATRLGVLSGRYLVRSAKTPRRLYTLLSSPAFGQGYMIDGPGTNPRDPQSLDRLRSFLRVEGLHPVLALSAEGTAEDLEETARAFASVGVRDVVLTRIDLVRRLGPAISAISLARLSLGQLSWVPSIKTGLVSANHHRIANLLLATTPETKPVERTQLKGAA